MLLKSLLMLWVSNSVNRVAPFGSNETPAHRSRFTDVVTSPYESLKLDSWSVLDFIRRS